MTVVAHSRVLALVVGAAVAAAVGVGLYLAGSPAEARVLRLDARRVDDLQGIQWGIEAWQHAHGRMPEVLDSVTLVGYDRRRVDPETGVPYRYTVTGDSSYTLCATFTRPSPDPERWRDDARWHHGTGEQCFELRVEGK